LLSSYYHVSYGKKKLHPDMYNLPSLGGKDFLHPVTRETWFLASF